MDQVAHQASILRDSKVNIHPLVDRCIHPTGHQNLVKGKLLLFPHSLRPTLIGNCIHRRSTPPAPGSAPPASADPYRSYGSGPYPPPPQQRPYGQQPPPVSTGPSQTPPAGPPGAASQPPVSGAPGQQPPSTIAQGQGYAGAPQPPQQPDYYRPDQVSLVARVREGSLEL